MKERTKENRKCIGQIYEKKERIYKIHMEQIRKKRKEKIFIYNSHNIYRGNILKERRKEWNRKSKFRGENYERKMKIWSLYEESMKSKRKYKIYRGYIRK